MVARGALHGYLFPLWKQGHVLHCILHSYCCVWACQTAGAHKHGAIDPRETRDKLLVITRLLRVGCRLPWTCSRLCQSGTSHGQKELLETPDPSLSLKQNQRGGVSPSWGVSVHADELKSRDGGSGGWGRASKASERPLALTVRLTAFHVALQPLPLLTQWKSS